MSQPVPVPMACAVVVVVVVAATFGVTIVANVVAPNNNAIACDASADAKLTNVARHLANGTYDVLLLPPFLPMLMLLRQLVRDDACDDVMLKLPRLISEATKMLMLTRA